VRLVVIGAGYVGLVTAACLADAGHRVVCVERDARILGALTRGVVPIFEHGLEELVQGAVAAGHLAFTSDLAVAVADAEVAFITVGAVPQVRAVAAELARSMPAASVIVTKSTVPVGTGDELQRAVLSARPKAALQVVSNPEFLREGSAIADFQRPARIVVGTNADRGRAALEAVYERLGLRASVLFTSRRDAELIKYASNAFLATKIAFVNELADLAERVGADVTRVAQGMSLDPRIGLGCLDAGPGYGGSCFPKDTAELLRAADEHGVYLRIVQATAAANEHRKRAMAERIIAACGGDVAGKTLAILGLTFKPGTDDMREAPSLTILPALARAGAVVRAHDPAGGRRAALLMREVAVFDDAYTCLQDCDAAVLLTEWPEYAGLDLERVRTALRQPILIDLRNAIVPAEAAKHGLQHHGIGRPRTRSLR